MPRILFLTPSNPFSVESGTHQRSHRLYQSVARLGQVDVVELVEGKGQTSTVRSIEGGLHAVVPYVRSLNPLTRYRPSRALTDIIEQTLKRSLRDYDVLIARYLSCATLIDARGVPVIADLDDLVFRSINIRLSDWGMWRSRVTKWLAWTLMRREMSRLTKAFVVTRPDLEIARRYVDAVWLPNVVEVPRLESQVELEHPATIMFVGSMWYGPNARGADWLLRHVWPKIRISYPQARLLIAGAAPAEVRSQWEQHPNVSAPGFVPDLRDAYLRASVVVVPIHDGGGSPIKLLEALAHARACVATTYAASAFAPDLEPGRHLLVADSSQAFASQIIKLLDDSTQARAMAQSGCDAVCAHFSLAGFDAQVKTTVEAFVAKN